MKICKKCETEIKCRHVPEHHALCFFPNCSCGKCQGCPRCGAFLESCGCNNDDLFEPSSDKTGDSK